MKWFFSCDEHPVLKVSRWNLERDRSTPWQVILLHFCELPLENRYLKVDEISPMIYPARGG
jgi:hypothetical protein